MSKRSNAARQNLRRRKEQERIYNLKENHDARKEGRVPLFSNKYSRAKEWSVMGLDELINDGTVYVHSSVKNFSRSLHRNKTALTRSANTIIKKLDDQLEDWKNQVKPSKTLRESDILTDLVSSSMNEDSIIYKFNNFKNVMLDLLRSPSIKGILSMETRTGKNNKTTYRVQGVRKKGNNVGEITTYEVKSPDIALKHLMDYIKAVFPSHEKDFKELNERLLDNSIKVVKKDFEDAVELLKQSVINEKSNDPFVIAAFNNLREALKAIDKNSNNYKIEFNKLEAIKNLNDLIENRKTVWQNSGCVYEDVIATKTIADKVGATSAITSVKNVGKINSKVNTSDLEVMIKGLDTKIGITVKQQINFNKSNKISPKDIQDSGLASLEEINDILDPYKYFILNYSLLDENESLERVKNKTNGKWIDTKMSEVGVANELYTLFNKNIGRIFIIQSLLGNIIKHVSKNGKSFAVNGLPVPYILLTEQEAVFTYDILDNLEELLDNGSIDILMPVYGLLQQYNKLVKAKEDALKRDPGITGYSGLLANSDVATSLTTLNRSAFKENGSININTTINIAKMMEALNNKKALS